MSRPLSPLSYGPSTLQYTQKGRERIPRPFLAFGCWLLPAARAAASAAAATATAATAATTVAAASAAATASAAIPATTAAIATTAGAGLRLEAVAAVDGTIAPGLERHLRVLAARSASNREELAVSARRTTATATTTTVGATCAPAVRATAGLIGEPLGTVEFLFPSGERKRRAAI